MNKILIVEDNREISDIFYNLLTANGYEAERAYDGRKAIAMLEGDGKEAYCLILLDLMMPYISGEDVIRELRRGSMLPVIVISAKSMKEIRLETLRLGADDYIIKPFDVDEVLVRIEVVLRRSGYLTEEGVKTLRCRNMVYYIDESRAFAINDDGTEREVKLTATEMDILKLLMENPKRTYTKAMIYESIWNDTYSYDDNTLNVHISNLRNKLKKAGADIIETVWGIGYRLKADDI